MLMFIKPRVPESNRMNPKVGAAFKAFGLEIFFESQHCLNI